MTDVSNRITCIFNISCSLSKTSTGKKAGTDGGKIFSDANSKGTKMQPAAKVASYACYTQPNSTIHDLFFSHLFMMTLLVIVYEKARTYKWLSEQKFLSIWYFTRKKKYSCFTLQHLQW